MVLLTSGFITRTLLLFETSLVVDLIWFTEIWEIMSCKKMNVVFYDGYVDKNKRMEIFRIAPKMNDNGPNHCNP